MTEQEWLQAAEPRPMVEFLQGKASDRKLRLFAVACCRRIWNLLTDERSRKAVEVAEQFADGQAGEEERSGAQFAAIEAAEAAATAYEEGPPHSCQTAAAEAASDAALAAVCQGTLCSTAFDDAMDAANLGNLHHTDGDARGIEYAAQVALLHDLFGNPFRPISFDPAWLTWHDGLLVSMAQRMYDSRDFSDMPVLADALEEAGCSDQDILGHCRGPGPHVRGCWVIDLVLGKT